MTKKHKLALAMNTLAIALVLLFVFLAVRDFLNQTEANGEKDAASRMALIADSHVKALVSETDRLKQNALLAADALAMAGGLTAPGAEDYLSLFIKHDGFEEIGTAYPDGRVPSGYTGADVSGEPWFSSAVGGASGVYADGKSGYLTAYAPVYRDGLVEGVFYGRCHTARLDAGSAEIPGEQQTMFFLLHQDGSFLYLPGEQGLFLKDGASSSNRFFTELENASYPDGDSADAVRAAIERKESGSFCIKTKTQEAHVCYMPAGVNDWYVLLAVDHAALNERNAALGRMAVELLAKVLFALLVAAFIVLFYSWATKQAAVNSANRINAMTNSIPCGVQQFEPSGNMAFRYMSDGFFQMSGYTEEELRDMFSNSFLAVIHPEDRLQVETLIRGNLDTEVPLELKYRIITKDGRVVWLLNRATLCFDEAGTSYYQCVCVDITRLKQVEQSLATKAQLDSLTGLYNRETARMLIREFFGDASSRYGRHAFFMLDMDGFKKYNDTYGHVEGDRMLCRIAGILRATFRGTDVLCRLAGDEFVAFMKSAESREAIAEKAQSILKRIGELSEGGALSPALSASIGISVAPEDGAGFEELYKRADEALYAAKRGGRNRYVFFDAMPAFTEKDFFDDLG